MKRAHLLTPFLVGLFLFLVATLLQLEASKLAQLRVSTNTFEVGPDRMLSGLSFVAALLGLLHWYHCWRQRRSLDSQVQETQNWSAVLWILLGMIGLILGMYLGLGFICSVSFLFVVSARAFGQNIGWKTILIGLILTSLVYVFFSYILGLSLPEGYLEKLLI